MSENRPGIKSIEVGGRLVTALVQAGGALSLGEIAADARMAPSKAHRYLVSFIRMGMVAQDRETRKYALGPLALQIGLAALGSFDPLHRAMEAQTALRNRVDETVVLSVWGGRGPTVIHVEESSHPVIMTMKVGALLPMLSTATGLVFGAFMPSILTRQLIAAELKHGSGSEPFARSRSSIEALFRDVRERRMATNQGHLMPGVTAIAAPVMSRQGQILAVMAIMGRDEHVNPEVNPAVAAALRQTVDAFSR